MSRLRAGEWSALIAGLALIVLLSLRWYEGHDVRDPDLDGLSTHGWTALAVPVVALLVIAIVLGLALALMTAIRRSPAIPVGLAVLSWVLGAVAACALLIQLVVVPDLGAGLAASQVTLRWPGYAGLVAAILLPAGAFRAMRDERTDSPGSEYVPPPPRPVPEDRAGDAAGGS